MENNESLDWRDWQQRVGFTDSEIEKMVGLAPRTLRRIRAGGVPSLKTVLLLIGLSRKHPARGRDARVRGRSIDFQKFDRWGALRGG